MTELSPSNPFDKTGFLVSLPTGEDIMLRKRVTWTPQEGDRTHILLAGEMLDMIAQRYYGNIRQNAQGYYWLIAEANNIINPLDLSEYVGKAILIPDITRLDFVV